MKYTPVYLKMLRRYKRKFLRSKTYKVLGKIAFVLFVLCCFPVGLYLLWKRNKNLPVAMRAGVTVLVAALVVSAVVIAMPHDPYSRGGVEYVSVTPNAEVYMPYLPAGESTAVSSYTNAYSAESVILLPTATPVPVYVWCNDMGKHYHTETCRYVKETTPRVTLDQALVGGFTPCEECKPPIK